MKKYRDIPKVSLKDNTLCLLLEGYQYMSNRRRKYHSQIFQTRLFGKKVICISGIEGAKLFYNHYYFTRKGVIPINIQSTLFGKNGVQTLVGSKHLNRKHMFTSIMTDENIKKLSQITRKMWEIESYKWPKKDTIILSEEAKIVLCKAACKWVGISLNRRKDNKIANDFYSLVDAIGSFGKRYVKGCIARKSLEKWLQNEIEDIRKRKEKSKHNLPAYYIAWYRDNTGNLLDSKTAAVELINVIRPIVAISTFITFGVLGLHDNPKWIRKIQSRKENKNHTLELFSQEVRRFYPFTPFLGAKVRKNFAWRGYYFKKGTLVLLDIYGINHDPRVWNNPYKFQPERFDNIDINPYNFIPQGGGSVNLGHRCPGERVTVELMKVSLDFIVNDIHFSVPEQNFTYSLSRIPSLPKSGMIIKDPLLIKNLKEQWK